MRTFSFWMMAFVLGVAESPALASGIEECVGTSADADHVAVHVDNAPASEIIADLIRVKHLRVDGVDRLSKAPITIHLQCVAMLALVGALAHDQEVKRDADGVFHVAAAKTPSPPRSPMESLTVAERAIDKGNYEEAMTHIEESHSGVEKEFAAATAQHLRDLAEYHCFNREYEKARPLLERMLHIEGKPSGTTDVDVVMTEILYELIAKSRNSSQYDLAIALYGQVIRLHEKPSIPGPIVADDLSNLADLYLSQRKYSQAEKLEIRSLAIREKTNSNVAAGLNRLAVVYLFQRRYQDTEPLLQRALALCEKEPHSYVESVTLENMADLYKETGRPTEAALAMKRADAIKAKLK